MAKGKKRHGDEDAADVEREPADMEVDAGTATPAEGDQPASVEGGTPTGTPLYPPPPSDAAGERTTSGVSPTKQLPTKAPEEENPQAPEPPKPLSRAIAEQDAEMARLRAENADLRKRLGEDDAPKAAARSGLKRFTVSLPGYADETVHAGDEKDAVAQYLTHRGIWSPPVQPTVAPAAD